MKRNSSILPQISGTELDIMMKKSIDLLLSNVETTFVEFDQDKASTSDGMHKLGVECATFIYDSGCPSRFIEYEHKDLSLDMLIETYQTHIKDCCDWLLEKNLPPLSNGMMTDCFVIRKHFNYGIVEDFFVKDNGGSTQVIHIYNR